MSDILERIDNLSPKKRKLLELMNSKRAQPKTAYPLSYAQQRLWVMDQLAPGGSAYNISFGVRLTGAVNKAALVKSVQEIVRRHEVLRTSFPERDGVAVQEVAHKTGFAITEVDLRHGSEEAREQEVLRRRQAEAKEPFDLQTGPLLRIKLLQLSEQQHVVLVTMHHIISDGWSTSVMVQELTGLYQAYDAGQPSPLPELKIQYGNFAAWQRRWLQGEVLEQHLGYWREQLADLPVLELPADRPRTAVPSYKGASQATMLDEDLTGALQELGRREGATLFMTLLGAFHVLLTRYSGQWDIAIGSPVANRNRTETEPLIGCFMNTLVLRTVMSGRQSFREALKQVRETTLGAYEHQDLPFEKLVEELDPQRDLSRNPLFQVMFNLQNVPESELKLADIQLTPEPEEADTAKFDLSLFATQFGKELAVNLEYSEDLFNSDSIRRMLGHWEALLRAIVADPDRPLAELPLMGDAERRQIAVEWNRTEAKYARETSLPRLIEEQAARTPQAVAVEFEGLKLTYEELNARANRLAHHLRKLGVGPETLVGICLERGLDMLAGTLAILKAGGAYVPLDPSYPAERLSYMLQDSQAQVLVTEAAQLVHSPAYAGTIVRLDEQREELARESSDNLDNATLPENLAYMIYTSGSTGKPKGVQISHAALVNFLWSMRTQPGIEPQDIMLAETTLSFDIAGLELYLPLIVGARVRILGREAGMDGARLLHEVDGGATIMQATPASWLLLLEAGWKGSPALKALCGGEALTPDLAKKLAGRCGSLWNMYGPTETAVWSLVDKIEDPEERISIGRPIANTQAYVLTEDLDAVPVGVTGELYIGGDGLARGYLKRGDLTADRFVPNPFSHEGERLYRTGDSARYRADGKLECLGRSDHQVKIRGYRIELGEIEAALLEHADIAQAAVVAHDDEDGQKRLVAYVVGRGPIAANELRAALKTRLPEYMAPSVFVTLDALPLTPNGKIDRRALAAANVDHTSRETSYIAPRTPAEEIVAGIWEQVLQLPRVGVEENFFELGGHSLIATRVVSRIRKSLGVELPLLALFEAPTVAGLAAWIDKATQAEPQAQAKPIVPVERTGDLPLSYAQQRLWFIDQLEPGSSLYNMPFGLRLKGTLDREALRRSLNDLVRRHEVLRTTFSIRDGVAVQHVAPELALDMKIVDLSRLSGQALEEAIRARQQAEAEQPFDLQTGPLARVTLLQVGEQEHVLLLTMHHIVSDGWSMGVLIKEVGLLYEAFRQDRPSALPELEIQYADYAVWQRDWLQGEVLEEQLAYWRNQLAGATMLALPTDHPQPAAPTHAGASERITFSPELTEGLKQLSRDEGVTLFMTLLAGFQILLARYTGQWDVAVGSLVANRNREETEGLIGFFMNTLVLRTQMQPERTFTEVLKQVREVTLGGYAHQDLPFEKLVEELDPERNLGRNPLFQALFTMQNMPVSELRLGDMQLTPEMVEMKTAKFDLGLFVSERANGLDVGLEYSSELFEAETIARLLGHWEALLQAAVAAPGRAIAELPLMPKEELRQTVVEWNQTALEYPRDRCFQEIFEQQAGRTPNAVAVEFEDQRLTYAQLNQRANQLAHRLRRMGIGPEVLVAICMERSLEFAVAMLAVVKAGGAYVPLDPGYPSDRLAYMLRDSQAHALLTERTLVSGLPYFEGTLIVLDEQWDAIGRESSQNPRVITVPENLAYVIYTSGSTGQPKGVLMQHRGMLNLIRAQQQTFAMQPEDCILQFSSWSFDASVWEICMAWANGARLHITRKENLLDGDKLAQVVTEKRVTMATLPPSLVGAMKPAQLDGITRLIVGGEASPASITAFCGDARKLFNVYGPTEITCVATIMQCAPSDEKPPIGQPIANTQAYVLDRWMQPAPVGVAGELYIAGPGLARGYLHQAGLTAERFAPNPFSVAGGERLYWTGDKVRYRADGNLEFLGRIDQQVKIRGHRIELGEIEAVLLQHPGVDQAVVVIREDRLVGYVVRQAGAEQLSLTELRASLKEHLPEYMLPAALVLLDELPLTPNKKVDRKALPEPEAASEMDYVAPRDAEEEILCDIWARVLGAERVGVEDNFFELGGHSLLATQLMSQVRSALDVELPLRALFETPTVAGLVGQVKDARGTGRNIELPLTPGARGADLPLSYAQQRLWFIDQLEPGSAAYNLPLGLRLRGELNRAALQWSFEQVLERHEVLRTSFATREGAPLLKVAAHAEVDLRSVDLQQLPEAEREAEARKLAHEEANQPFHLSAGPLLRARLLQLGEQEHVLLVTMHHIVSDGWSVGILVREFSQFYEAYTAGQSPAMPELQIQYADFAAWQRQWLDGGVLEQQMKYWREKLADVPALELPADYPRPAVMSHRGGSLPVELPVELTEKLKDLGRREGVTLFMILLAAFQTLLSKYAGQRDVAIGTVIANRTRKEIEGLVGFFANTLVLRTQVEEDQSFRELLQRVRQTTLKAYEHQDVPFEKLVDELQPIRDLSRTPLFQVMLSLQNIGVGELELAGLALGEFGSSSDVAKFDLNLELAEWAGGISGALSYARDLFTPETVAQMGRHLRVVLEAMVADPARLIGGISLLNAAERRQALVEWNQTQAELPQKCLHEIFEDQVDRTPQAIAAIHEGQQLTYAELNARANRLARYLTSLAVGPESRVGIFVERGLDMLVGLLGIMKAGAGYVPLDLSHPVDRLAYVIDDSRITVLLTQSKLRNQIPPYAGQVVEIDGSWEQLSSENLPAKAWPESLAYVIYTSGSTGKPKGVQISHQALVNFLFAMRGQPGIGSHDKLLAVTTLSFDIAGLELYLPLIVGAQVTILSREASANGMILAEELGKGITIMQATPASWRMALEAGWAGTPGLKLLCGGEALPPELAKQLVARSGSSWNMYGPTETTIWSLVERLDRREEQVSIGSPIANTTVFVLDEQMEPAPLGARGELFIGGSGLARGYWNRPDLTAEKFVPNPFNDVPGDRLYRSGDVVRWRRDGRLEFLGRTDHQVKIRGYRIELGEIEAALSKCSGVAQAVVIAREDQPGEKRLTGYVTRQATVGALSIGDLRSSLRGLLPEYMVPAAFVVLDEFPLTPNGKVDRKALPRPQLATQEQKYVKPRTGAEHILSNIWSEVLGKERIGVHDNFFELGGDSIQSIQVVARAVKAGIELTPQQLFKFQTIGELAEIIAKNATSRNEPVSEQASALTADDFPLANLTEEELLQVALALGE